MTRLLTARQLLVALMFGFCLTGPRAFAQAREAEGLEQTYARLCGNGQTGETCTALRQALMAKLSGEGATATGGGSAQPLPGQVPAGAPAQPTAATLPAAPPYWGHYLDLVKEPRVMVLVEAMYALAWESPIATYTWEVPGQVMGVSSTGADGSTARVATLTWDAQRGALVQKQVSNGNEALLVPQADGSFIQEGESIRIIERKYNNGTIEQRTEVKRETGWDLVSVYHMVPYTPEGIGLLRQIHANAVETSKLNAQIPAKYRDAEFQRQIHERAEARSKANGGFFRAMIGAGLGLAAANAGGMDAAQTIGAAAKGAALMAPDSKVAQVVGASGDAILQNSGLGTAATGAASTGAGGTASYPTRPNVLAGQAACTMMNESNYRQVGVSGGTDVQLKTMCAQAYEYYTMYKRAIAQGYSEADANRTYAAHQQAAQNAIAFHANNRAR